MRAQHVLSVTSISTMSLAYKHTESGIQIGYNKKNSKGAVIELLVNNSSSTAKTKSSQRPS